MISSVQTFGTVMEQRAHAAELRATRCDNAFGSEGTLNSVARCFRVVHVAESL